MSALPPILVVDGDTKTFAALDCILSGCFNLKKAATIEEAQAILADEAIEVVLCNQHLAPDSGLDFLRRVRECWPEIVGVLMLRRSDLPDIVDRMSEAGVSHTVMKPWQPEGLKLTLTNAVRLYRLQRENELLAIEVKLASNKPGRMSAGCARTPAIPVADDGVVRHRDSPMNAICATMRQIAPFDISVMITGESGTGKELIARALHHNSLRWNKPFVVENCAALPDELLESELFGHRRGAFTGAVEDHVGLFQRADGGTVFLDEIGEISPAFQAKLLRVLQDGELRPVGGRRTRTVDVRVIAATNRNLEAEVAAGRFREDLYYRLETVSIHVPPLRERPMDIPVIAEALLEKAQAQFGKTVKGLSKEALACLTTYRWPGNVRELQNAVQQMLIMAPEGGVIGTDHLPRRVRSGVPHSEAATENEAALSGLEGTLKERVESVEAVILRESLIRNRWNKSKTAKELGLSRVGLRAKLERYGLEKIEALPLEPAKKKRAS